MIKINKLQDRKKNKGFTLMEVLISVAIAGLVITAGFKLIAMSYRLLGEVEAERELVAAAQRIWLRFRVDPGMPDSGKDDKNNISWSTENDSLPFEDYEISFKRVKVTLNETRSMIIYVPDD